MARADPVPPALTAVLGPLATVLWRSPTGKVVLGRASGAFHPAVVPPELAGVEAALAVARFQTSPPLSARAVERILRAAWGTAPAEVLDELGPCVASTPVAQVHRGRLAGEPVAVNVRRPGAGATLRSDRSGLEVARSGLGVDPLGAGTWVLDRLADTLDFEHAAGQQRALARALRDVPGVVVPAVVSELSRPDVLVCAWLDGPPLGPGVADSPLAERILAAHLIAARAGLLMEPRPAHVVLLARGKVGLLGAGDIAAVDPATAERGLGLLTGLGDPDGGRFAEAAGGRLPDTAGLHALLRDVLGELVLGPARLDGAALASVLVRAGTRAGDLRAAAGRLATGPDELALASSAVRLAGLLALLGQERDWLALSGLGRP